MNGMARQGGHTYHKHVMPTYSAHTRFRCPIVPCSHRFLLEIHRRKDKVIIKNFKAAAGECESRHGPSECGDLSHGTGRMPGRLALVADIEWILHFQEHVPHEKSSNNVTQLIGCIYV